MPPKAKYTRAQITEAALEIVRTEGFEKLTARALGKKLGSSACPVFTVFQNMEEVQRTVLDSVRDIYRKYIEKGLSENLAFKGVGIQYILFAINELKLFQILFMREQTEPHGIDNVLPVIDEKRAGRYNYEKILASITAEYGIAGKDAERLYQHLWIYTHGIATLCVTQMCCFTSEEINEMMTEVFIGLLKR